MNPKQESYAEKIAKLLRKAESTTPEEAEALMAKAQELMTKYAIDEAMIAAARGLHESLGEVLKEEFVLVGIYRFPMTRLTRAVMLSNDVEDIQLSGVNWRRIGGKMYKETVVLYGVGFKADLDRVRMLQTSLMLQALSAESAWWRENSNLYSHLPKGKQHLAKRGFLFAFADGAYLKMREATQRGKAAAEREHSEGSVALVLRDKSLAVKNAFEEMFPDRVDLKNRKSQGDLFAQDSGFQAGQNADVGQTKLGNTNRKELA